jgi:alcohol dehydrogenase (cytochrome c)
VFERTIATLNVKGTMRRTVTTAGKMGIFDTLDAATGAYLFSHDLGLQNLIAEIDPKTGAKKIAPAMEPTPNVQQIVCPSNIGGRNWPSTAFNPSTGIMYVPMLESCMPYKYVPGTPAGAFLSPPVRRPDSDGKLGRMVAFDLATGKTIWMKRRRAPEIAAILATAGGLVFDGSRDRWFRASDDRTGDILWDIRLDGVPSSFPITYEVDGTQYIAVTTGGGNPVDNVAATLTPEIVSPISGTTLWTFRLPQK